MYMEVYRLFFLLSREFNNMMYEVHILKCTKKTHTLHAVQKSTIKFN